MSFENIAVFWAIILIYRLIFDYQFKNQFIFVFSLIAIYWLQPTSSIRYWDYWIPSISILLIILCWVIVTPQSRVFQKYNIKIFIALIAIIIIITTARYLSAQFSIIKTRPPQISVITYVILLSILLLTIVNLKNGFKLKYSYLLLVAIISIFIFYKTPFLITKIAYLIQSFSGGTAQIKFNELRWIGFSYLAFRLLHVLRDRQADRYVPIDLDRFISFAIFFPAITAGPIARIEHFNQEIDNKNNRFVELTNGVKRITIGLFNKFVIADSLAIFSLNSINALQITSTHWLWVHLIGYSLQIYFDFCGYTDIAIGLANCLGINLPENFNKPFCAPNLTQFWNRWHMSLTQWFRAYFFNPINRFMKSGEKPVPSTLLLLVTQVSTMFLIGLWHGISLNFIIWGLWHGLGLFIQNRWSSWTQPFVEKLHLSEKILKSMKYLSVFITIAYVTIGWIWFAINDTNISLFVLKKLLGLGE